MNNVWKQQKLNFCLYRRYFSVINLFFFFWWLPKPVRTVKIVFDLTLGLRDSYWLSMLNNINAKLIGCTTRFQTIMWIVYNDAPTNGNTTFTLGHSKGTVVADSSSGFWLVHSVPHFPQLPYQNNNSYTYPKTGVKYGQSFLCMSMTAQVLDKVGQYSVYSNALKYLIN